MAAHEGSFSLYALKSMDEIREAVQTDDAMDEVRFRPVKEVSIPAPGKQNSRELGLTFLSGRKGIYRWKGRY